MAVFLAAVAQGDSALPSGLSARMRDVLAVAGEVQSVAQGQVALAYCDLGLWPGPSATSTADGLTVVAGDPLICKADRALLRHESIDEIANMDADSALLASAEGTYCGVQWNRSTSTLMAFTDKLGVRPLYFARGANVLYISSSQWALNALADVPKEPDWRAATEVAAVGYPLGNRTLYTNIKILYAGEMLIANARNFHVRRYWDWSCIPTNTLSGAALTDHVRRSFNTAMDDRVQNQKRVMAFLSGGMDSRLIVSRLRENGVAVDSLNFAPEGSQDLALGRMAADAMGTDHFEYGGGASGFMQRQADALDAWKKAHPDTDSWPERPGLFWSGDDGSVTLGNVYVTAAMLAAARTLGPDAAAAVIQRQSKFFISKRVLCKPYRRLVDIPLQGIIEDLRSRPNVEPGRNCHYFFVFNHQRRHLVKYYETVHLTRVDFVLPFLDGRFMAAVLGSAIDPFMRHALYNDLMPSLPGRVTQVPWQAYPGHLPCPLPIPGNLRQQWEDGWLSPALSRREDRKRYKAALQHISSSSFPSHVLNRAVLLAACTASYVGFAGSAWLLKVIDPYRRAWGAGRPSNSSSGSAAPQQA